MGYGGRNGAILIRDISNVKLINKPITEKDQINVFGRKFDKLRQKRRFTRAAVHGEFLPKFMANSVNAVVHLVDEAAINQRG